MPDSMAHLSEWTLEQLAEGALPAEEEAGTAAHLAACARCTAELDAYRALFSALADLPRFAPSPVFGDAVLARVQIAPQAASWMVTVQRWLPTTGRGWALLGVALVAPVIPLLAAVVWLLSHPLVSPASLLHWGTGQGQTAAQGVWSAFLDWGLGSGLMAWAQGAWGLLGSIPAGTLTGVLVGLAVAIPLSAWSLVRLLRTPMGNVHYAN